MREKWARRIAVLTGLLVLALAIVFAISQNPTGQPPQTRTISAEPAVRTPAPPARGEIAAADQALIESGKRVYAEQGCARCHSIAGRGSDRSPLDGVGARLSAEELKSWIVTPKEQAPQTAGSFRARHANRNLARPELDALVTYLRSLRDESPARKNGVSN